MPRNGKRAWISEVAGADKARVAREGRGVTAFCAGQGHLGKWIPGRTLSATVETQPLAVPQFLQMQREARVPGVLEPRQEELRCSLFLPAPPLHGPRPPAPPAELMPFPCH